jgi:hypothetical protein
MYECYSIEAYKEQTFYSFAIILHDLYVMDYLDERVKFHIARKHETAGSL